MTTSMYSNKDIFRRIKVIWGFGLLLDKAPPFCSWKALLCGILKLAWFKFDTYFYWNQEEKDIFALHRIRRVCITNNQNNNGLETKNMKRIWKILGQISPFFVTRLEVIYIVNLLPKSMHENKTQLREKRDLFRTCSLSHILGQIRFCFTTYTNCILSFRGTPRFLHSRRTAWIPPSRASPQVSVRRRIRWVQRALSPCCQFHRPS